MKKHIARISAVLFALLIIFFSDRGILQIAANSQLDKDINHQLLGSSSENTDTNYPLGGSSVADIESLDESDKIVLGDSQVALGSSVSTFGTFGTEVTIAGIIPETEKAKIVIVPGTNASSYQSYPGTPVGMAEALMNLYTNGNNKDYTIYMGAAITMPLWMGKEVPAASPTTADISFSALKGNVGTLTLLANIKDPLDMSTVSGGTIATISFPVSTYFGTNVIIRNISYATTNFYMMGNSITLGRGSYFYNGINVFGGTSAGDITGNPTISIYSTGAGTSNFYGGNQTSGTLTGDAAIAIHNTSATPIITIAGGALKGNIVGSTSVTIHTTGPVSSLSINSMYGGSVSGDVSGDTTTLIHESNHSISSFYGGAGNGNVGGNVSNTIHKANYFITNYYGGSYEGTVDGNVTNTIDYMGGNLQFFYGGGYGVSAIRPASVGGNVSTTILDLKGSLSNYYGGMYTGNIGGSVTNVFKGTGQFVAPSNYYGGSYSGDIGASLAAGSTAISSDFDSSQFLVGSAYFAGANSYSGTITGNIKNRVTAGNVYNKGAIYSFSGGAGEPSRAYSGHGGDATYDNMTPEVALTAFMKQSASKHKIYGNIDNEITQGIVSYATDNSYTRSAGFSGYVEGDITTRIGTEGKVSSYNSIDLVFDESNSKNNRGFDTAYDIVGGGGSPGYLNSIYIKGNTHLELNNVMARWTYGGSFSGLLDGNSTIMLHSGVVDTLEGTGYNNQQQWGNGFAHVLGGQVDWFLSGGGWNDRNLYGNAAVTVEGGTINASMGGTFGASGYHYIHGDTTILVTGGDFSGNSRADGNGFSGGATNLGTVYGNTSVTLDLRSVTVPFKLPTGTSITGGRRFNANAGSYLGTDANNTIELNIFTKSGSDVLNGASIYGDGSIYSASTKSGKITINIDAPDSSVGNFYATQYSNIASNKLLRDVTFNIHNLKSVVGLSGGTKADNFTNINASTSTNKSTININPAPLVGETSKAFAVGVDGIVNFTDFYINDTIVEVTGAGGIKNGSGVTAANHGTTYHQFGNINITNGGGFKIGTSTLVSGSMLTVDGRANLTSPSGTGKLIVSDLTIGADDSIYWTRIGGTPLESVTGNWYGENQGYKVITFNPVRDNATKVTPYNFTGVDDVGKIYLGDNENSSNFNNGHAIAVPGTRIDFKVVGGEGTISHNVDKVLPAEAPPLNGASNQDKDAQTTSGWLNFADSFKGAKLTFTPDTASGSWLKNVKITRSDGNVSEITEVTHSSPVEWLVPEKGYAYVVEVTYTNQSELSGRSVMISQTEAKAIISEKGIMDYQEISGRPFLTHDINEALIAEINKPLGEGVKVRSHTITYTVGTTGNKTTRHYDIGIVPDSAVIEKPGRRGAIDANDATMMLAAANGMSETNLATSYTYPMAYLPDGTAVNPTLDSTTIAKLNSMITPTSVDATYSYALTDPAVTISKTVIVLVIPDGKLVLNTVPVLGFGQTTIPTVTTKYWKPTSSTLIVEDSRINPHGSDWEVTLRVTDLVSGTESISASDIVYTNTTAANGPTGEFYLNDVTTVWESTTKAEDTQTMTWEVSTTEGFSVQLDPLSAKLGTYEGTATWSVQITPTP